jgi:hypothetical protein
MEIETIDPFIGYTNQKGKRTDIGQRDNPPLPQTWRMAYTTNPYDVTHPSQRSTSTPHN